MQPCDIEEKPYCANTKQNYEAGKVINKAKKPQATESSLDRYSSSSNDTKGTIYEQSKSNINLWSHSMKRPHSHLEDYLNKVMNEYEHLRVNIGKKSPPTVDLPRKTKKAEERRVSKLLRIQSQTSWNDQDNEVYVISSKWLTRWKNYIKNIPNPNSIIEEPGPINYDDIKMDDDKYYNPLTQDTQFSCILKETAKEEMYYFAISKELWNFYHDTYEGDEAIRYRIHIGPNNDNKIDTNFYKVNFKLNIGKHYIYNKRTKRV